MGNEKLQAEQKIPTLDDLDLDRRQFRLLGTVIREYVTLSQEPDLQQCARYYRDLDSVPNHATPATTRDFWHVLPDEHKLLVLPVFYEQDAPRCRRVGKPGKNRSMPSSLSVSKRTTCPTECTPASVLPAP